MKTGVSIGRKIKTYDGTVASQILAALTVLKINLKCSFMPNKLRFCVYYCLVITANIQLATAPAMAILFAYLIILGLSIV